jgi:hypothetical protein
VVVSRVFGPYDGVRVLVDSIDALLDDVNDARVLYRERERRIGEFFSSAGY